MERPATTATMQVMGAWAAGSDRRWRRTRALVLANNLATHRGRCQVGTALCTGRATCVHHTRGRAVTGDDPRYLIASCDACNQHIGDPTVHDESCVVCRPDPRPRRVTNW